MSRSAPAPVRWIALGRIVGLFGVRGQMKVQSYTDPVEGLLNYATWRLELPGGGQEQRTLQQGRRHGRGLVVSLEGITDCDVARTLIGAQVEVTRGELPRLAEHEYYRADLIGLEVYNERDVLLGKVAHFLEMPAHPIMVVRGESEHWLPVTPQHLRQVDLAAGRIRVDWDPGDE